MKKLFEDLYILDRDKVCLVAHCFKKSARVWWREVKQNQPASLPSFLAGVSRIVARKSVGAEV